MKNPVILLRYFFLFTFLIFFSGNILAEDIEITKDTVWEAGDYTYDNVQITNGATLTINGKVTLTARNLAIANNSFISADGKGYPAQQGPGVPPASPGWPNHPADGGGYGGKGGKAYIEGGPVYGSALHPQDLGSGGGAQASGAGGGAIKLTVLDTLAVNGTITAAGEAKWSGGSGGSIYIISNVFTGTGIISANGGGSIYSNAGGGGGRVAIYYETNTFTGIAQAKAGIGVSPGSKGEDGTVVFNSIASLTDAVLTIFSLTETTSNTNNLVETILVQEISSTGGNITGNLQGSIDFTNFKIITIDAGPFKNKGLFKAQWQVVLEGAAYQGIYNGVIYPDSKENKIYLKGTIEGDLEGVAELSLTEAVPDSGVYDLCQGTWDLKRIGTDEISLSLEIEASLSYQSSSNFSSELSFTQSNFEGICRGHYTGPLNLVVNHLLFTDDNEYQNEGFSLVSYTSDVGCGSGWFYNELLSSKVTEFTGLFNNPLSGFIRGLLNNNVKPKTLTGTIDRLDLGREPAPDLKVKVWSSGTVSPGEPVNYIIEYRNDGVKAATQVIIYDCLSPLVSYKSASPGVYYDPYSHEVSWDLGALPAKNSGYLSIRTEVLWGIPAHEILENRAYILDIVLHSTQENGFGNGICYNSDNPNQHIIYKWFSSQSDAEWFKIYNKTNLLTGPLEVYLASKNVRTARNGVGDKNSLPPDDTGSIIYGNKQSWIANSGGTATLVNQAKHDYISGEELYLITPQLVTQEDLQALKSKFTKIVVYQGDDLIPDAFAYALPALAFQIESKFSKERWIYLAKITNPNDTAAEFLLDRIEETEGKTIEFLELFPKEPGNQVRVTWEEDAPPLEITIAHVIESEDGIEVVTIPRTENNKPGINHDEWIPVLFMFKDKYDRFPGEVDIEKLEAVLKEFRDNHSSIHFQENITSHDPNEISVSPQGEVLPGETLNYTISYENAGEGIAFGVYITDRLEEDLDDSNLTIHNAGVYDEGTKTITWFIGRVEPKGQGSVSFSVKVKNEAQEGVEIINFATVYFPSVPEETRTNGVVNLVKTTTDSIPPATQINIQPSANAGSWYNSDIIVILTAADNEAGSGVKEIHYALSGVVQDEQTISGDNTQIFLSTEGTTVLTYYAVDNEGNIEPVQTAEFKLDKTPPVIEPVIVPQPNSYGWHNQDVIVSFNANDTLSGIKTVTEPVTVAIEGKNQLIGGQAIDYADNQSSTYAEVNLDKTQPVITAAISPQANSYGWHNTDVTVSFTAQDNLSGIRSVTEPIIVTTEGKNQNIIGEALDYAGNKTVIEIPLSIDKTPPQVTITAAPDVLWPPNNKMVDVTISGETADDLSDIVKTTFTVEDEYNTVEPVITSLGDVIQLKASRDGNDKDGRTYTISVLAEDKAGNKSRSSTIVICPHDQRKK